MPDLKDLLSDSVCLAFETADGTFTYSGRGVKPLLCAIEERGERLNNASAADRTVGRAAAMLFAYAKVSYVFAATLSKGGKAVLDGCGVLTEKILNRDKTDICPMEKACAAANSPEEAFGILAALVGKLSLKALTNA